MSLTARSTTGNRVATFSLSQTGTGMAEPPADGGTTPGKLLEFYM